jgi:hypothetical protein
MYLVYNTVVQLCQFFVVAGNRSQNENTFLQKNLIGLLWGLLYGTDLNSLNSFCDVIFSFTRKICYTQIEIIKKTRAAW